MTTAAVPGVRVWVPDVWDVVAVPAGPGTRVSEVKAAALAQAIGAHLDPADYEVKFRGAAIPDESRTLGDLNVPAGAPMIVLPARRRPVR